MIAALDAIASLLGVCLIGYIVHLWRTSGR
jgi:cbb3-type cytochrome oxidase subunit 3